MSATGKALTFLVCVIGLPTMFGVLFLGAGSFEWSVRVLGIAIVGLLTGIAQALFRIAYRED
jgi:hypothetical protein